MRHPATLAILTACLGVHAYLAFQTDAARVAFEDTWGLTPAFLATAPTLREAATLTTSLFVHASAWSLGACMLLLAAAGPRVEESLGSVAFLAYYLVSGAVGGLLVTWQEPGAIVPHLGAWAAVAGVAIAWLALRVNAGQRLKRLAPRTPSAPYAGTAS